MKTSLDLPDDLYRRVKARSAMEGRAVREVATELLAAWVDSAPATDAPTPSAKVVRSDWLYAWNKLGVRVDRASAKPKRETNKGAATAKPTRKRAKSRSPDASEGLVEQLRRDRR